MSSISSTYYDQSSYSAYYDQPSATNQDPTSSVTTDNQADSSTNDGQSTSTTTPWWETDQANKGKMDSFNDGMKQSSEIEKAGKHTREQNAETANA